jgi:hypothetical protein
MADIDLAATGKDISITITYDGAVIRAYEHVSWETEPMLEVTRTKPLGTTETQIDSVIEGWKGTLELETSQKDADELLDIIISTGILRVPGLLAFKETTHYRDLSNKSYLYLDCKIVGAPKSSKRGEKTKLRFSWESGKNRIAV